MKAVTQAILLTIAFFAACGWGSAALAQAPSGARPTDRVEPTRPPHLVDDVDYGEDGPFEAGAIG